MFSTIFPFWLLCLGSITRPAERAKLKSSFGQKHIFLVMFHILLAALFGMTSKYTVSRSPHILVLMRL